MTTGAGSLNPAGDENDVAVPGVETGAGLETTGTGVTVGVAAGDVMPVAGVDTAGTGIGMGTEAGGLNAAGTAPGFVAVGSGVLVNEARLAGAAAGASGAGFPPVAGAALPGSVAGAAPAPPSVAVGRCPIARLPVGRPPGPPACFGVCALARPGSADSPASPGVPGGAHTPASPGMPVRGRFRTGAGGPAAGARDGGGRIVAGILATVPADEQIDERTDRGADEQDDDRPDPLGHVAHGPGPGQVDQAVDVEGDDQHEQRHHGECQAGRQLARADGRGREQVVRYGRHLYPTRNPSAPGRHQDNPISDMRTLAALRPTGYQGIMSGPVLLAGASESRPNPPRRADSS
jgi:hypothetical protein